MLNHNKKSTASDLQGESNESYKYQYDFLMMVFNFHSTLWQHYYHNMILFPLSQQILHLIIGLNTIHRLSSSDLVQYYVSLSLFCFGILHCHPLSYLSHFPDAFLKLHFLINLPFVLSTLSPLVVLTPLLRRMSQGISWVSRRQQSLSCRSSTVHPLVQ